MVDNTSTNFPNSKTRFTNEQGLLSKEGSTLLRALWNRTGGGTGGDTSQAIALANAAQASADASLKITANLSDVADVALSRNNLGIGSVASGNTVPGWTDPTGAGSRAAFDANWTTTVSNPPTQAEMTSVRDQVIAVQKALAQVIVDLQSASVISN